MEPNTNPLLTPKQLDHLIEVTDRNLSMHQETKNISYKALNNIIFGVSTGTFVLSISLIGYLKTTIYFPILLVLAWVALIVAIIGNYYAHVLTISQSRRQMQLINGFRASGFQNAHMFDTDVVANDSELNQNVKVGRIANMAVLISLGLGLLFVFLFAAINLLAQNEVRKDEARHLYQPRHSIEITREEIYY
jgi:hypothetical protein